MNYSLDDLFAPTSPYFNGASLFGNTAGSQNAFSQAVNPAVVGVQQSGENIKQLGLSTPIIVVEDTDSLQKAINKLHEIGGGIIQLIAGTYTIKTAITGYSSISIIGISPTATIFDFASTSANLAFAGTSIYATGTITSITSGVTVVGSGTSWSTNVVAGMSLFLGTRWYVIAVVTDDTHLTLAEAYIDNLTFPGAAYRIGYPVVDVTIKNLTVKNSTGTGITVTDGRRIIMDFVLSTANNKGLVLTNVAECALTRVLPIANTSNGMEASGVGLSDWSSLNCIGNGGIGLVMNNVKTFSIYPSACNANTGDGVNMTTCVDIAGFFEASGNGGQGIELVSGNDNVVIHNGSVQGNTSDGIKLTASSDNCKIYANQISGNGGYGVNIAASTCDNNVIALNGFASNTSGAVSDSGTGTVIGLNPGV